MKDTTSEEPPQIYLSNSCALLKHKAEEEALVHPPTPNKVLLSVDYTNKYNLNHYTIVKKQNCEEFECNGTTKDQRMHHKKP